MTVLTDFASGVVVKMLNPAPSCKIKLPKSISTIAASGGNGAFEVHASGSCAWQAVSTADWLKVKTDVYANGSAAVTFTATPSASGNRQGAILIQPLAGMPPIKGHSVQLVEQR
jgi:hypothetical protein